MIATLGNDQGGAGTDVAALIPLVRRVVSTRVNDPVAADDLVQETLVRVLGAAGRVETSMLEPYAIATARNLVASMWKAQDRDRRNRHRVVELDGNADPDEDLLRQQDRQTVAAALSRLSDRDRQALVAHEVSGQDTRSLAAELGVSAGAVAAQLNRARARLRVEYLLAARPDEPPTDRCRAILLSISGGDRRRQREVDAAAHLLECDFCAELSEPLIQRGQSPQRDVRVPIRADADIVTARREVRRLALEMDFARTDATVLATAVSEIARNIVRFAGEGTMLVQMLDDPRAGIRVLARDHGPGIDDVDKALTDGYSTYRGLGLGLPGARRLMDEFSVVSEVDHGTTVIMTKWRREGSAT
ncbi:MAG TPA: sigma-70 family RNA polymerase sigma factor [Microlunatus sp.]|nr:sigma-70 family RNA polymerase sigma factor [Microlunatus sp.]